MFIPNRVLYPITVGLALAASFLFGVANPPRVADYTAVAVMTQSLHREPLTYVSDVDRGPTITAGSAVVVDVASRTVLYAKGERIKRAPASTTKVLTAIIAIEKGKLDDMVSVSKSAAGTPGTTLHLSTGDKIKLCDILTGMMLRSGNDAALAIAQHIAGDSSAFAEMMNAKAESLGATDSNFVNPHGLDNPGHYTTAKDLALIALAAIDNPTFAKIVRTKTTEVSPAGKGWTREVNNTNQLLWSFDGAEGVKTGTTSRAGQCLIALATRQGRQLLTVVLGSRSRYWDTRQLLEYGFDDFALVTGAEKDEVVDVVDIEKGMKEEIPLVAASTSQFMVHRDDVEDLELMLKIPTPLCAPVKKGQIIGELVATVDNRRLASTPLVVADSVPRRTWWRLILEWWGFWFRDVVSVLSKA